MTDLVKKNDIIIPLAALVGAPLCDKDPIASTSINKDSVKWLFEACSSEQILIMPTTNSAYGVGDKNHFCDEKSKLNPISKYAKDKDEVEKHLIDMKNFISLRLATVLACPQE